MILAHGREEGIRGWRGGVEGSLQTMKENCNMRTGHSHTWQKERDGGGGKVNTDLGILCVSLHHTEELC